MTTTQDLWSSPCNYLCCFMRKHGDEEDIETEIVSGDSPGGLINDGDNLNKYGAINHDEEDVSWDDLAIRHDSDEGIDITDDLSLENTDGTEEHMILTNPLHSDKLTSDEDEASAAQTRILVKAPVQTEVIEGQENPVYVPSPVPEGEEEEEEEQGHRRISQEEDERKDARMSQEDANETLHVLEDELNVTSADENMKGLEKQDIRGDSNDEKEGLEKQVIRGDSNDDVITPEPLLILPSVTPPQITVTSEVCKDNSVKIQNSLVPTPVPLDVEESYQDIGSSNDLGSTDSLSKQKKKSKFKKFKLFKRKKKKKDKLSDEYKSSPSLNPGGQKMKSGYSMSSIISNLDPDERNIASD